MNKEILDEIIIKHKMFLKGESGGECADLRGADLRGVVLSKADLSRANLSGADLKGANLKMANLIEADLSLSNLEKADFRLANLEGTDLRLANLKGADLKGANLKMTNLRAANLKGANLRKAIIKGTDFSFATLEGSEDLSLPMACPEKGAFIGYKKASGKIVELEILPDSKRSSGAGRKCRCSKAKVISITNLDGSESNKASVVSNYDKSFIYTVGEIVEEHGFDECRWRECSPGIHFFMNREEALAY